VKEVVLWHQLLEYSNIKDAIPAIPIAAKIVSAKAKTVPENKGVSPGISRKILTTNQSNETVGYLMSVNFYPLYYSEEGLSPLAKNLYILNSNV